MSKKTIVISGVNLFQGGTLTILLDNLKFANNFLSNDYKIIALVHKIDLFENSDFNKIVFMEFPNSRKSYLMRLYFEYFYFKKLSKKLRPYLWFSLHDITPNVTADIRAVYCHNPSPFKKILLSDLFFQPVLFFFSLFYKFLYKINLKKNDFVVVQQIWIKTEFVNLFKIQMDKILVCYPEYKKLEEISRKEDKSLSDNKNVFTFFYPALARPFKNYEVIGEAIKVLEKKGINNFQVIITIKGDENNYAKHIFRKYESLKKLQFVGMLSFTEVNEYYKKTDALLFPSTIETWGLPITEFKSHGKPIILSNLPYAFETLGEYEKGCFFDPLDENDLAEKMASLISGNLQFDKTSKMDEEVLIGWSELYNKILVK
jgi:glycosyltransferase involved in cell wall biosynthesis